MAIDPVTIKLVVDVISAILPFGELANAWSNYLNYRSKKIEINYKIKELEAKVPLAKEYIKAKTQVELKRLQNERNSFDKRIAILESELTSISLDRSQISSVIEKLSYKLNDARGDDLKHITQAISHLTSCLTKQTVSVFDLLSKEIGLQQLSIGNSIDNFPQLANQTKLIDGG